MLLPYEKSAKPPTFFGYRMHYLSHPQQMKFTTKVKIFQCTSLSTTDIRVGIADMTEEDRMTFIKMLNNVAGSLPITVKEVRRPMEEEDDVLFVTARRQRASIFNSRGKVISFEKLPKVCEAMVALNISGMKVKDDEASFILSVAQIMVKQEFGGNNSKLAKNKLLFPVSSDEDDDDDEEEEEDDDDQDESMMVE